MKNTLNDLMQALPPTEVKKEALKTLEEIRDGTPDSKHPKDLKKRIELVELAIELDEEKDFYGGYRAFIQSTMMNGFD